LPLPVLPRREGCVVSCLCSPTYSPTLLQALSRGSRLSLSLLLTLSHTHALAGLPRHSLLCSHVCTLSLSFLLSRMLLPHTLTHSHSLVGPLVRLSGPYTRSLLLPLSRTSVCLLRAHTYTHTPPSCTHSYTHTHMSVCLLVYPTRPCTHIHSHVSIVHPLTHTHTCPCACLCILHDRALRSLPHACSPLSLSHSLTLTRPSVGATRLCSLLSLFLSHTHTLTPSGRSRVSLLWMPSLPSYLGFTYTYD
jgi:hypothetical protein